MSTQPASSPIVSVIVPFYNPGQFLQEAIESVLAQSFIEWELLLVDDGSTDTSTAIACRYQNRRPEQIHYLEHERHQNRGKSAARNLGIHQAAGKYITFLDADDCWLPNILEDQVAILEKHPEAGMVYGPIQWWYSWSDQPEDRQKDYVEDLGVPPDAVIDPPEILAKFLQNKAAVPSDIMVRRNIIEQVGEFEEEFTMLYEDQVFVAKICLHTPVFASGKCWYRYRQHPNSSCSIAALTGENDRARPKFLFWLEQYISRHLCTDPDLTRALKEELWPFKHPALHAMNETGRNLVSKLKGAAVRAAGATIPVPIRRWLWSRWTGQEYIPPTGRAIGGNFRRLSPFSRESGYDRGQPIDRYYIEKFLSNHRMDIQGHVLEMANNAYTRQFGEDRVVVSDVWNYAPGDCLWQIPAENEFLHS